MTIDNFFSEEQFYTCPKLTARLISDAESFLGVKLPASYLELLSVQNGGTPKRCCFPTDFETSWEVDHFAIEGIFGIGGKLGIGTETGFNNRDLIEEWDYPNIGVVICITPSAGEDTVMLDYRESGPTGEPCVVYVDEDRLPRKIADNFEQFIEALFTCPDE